MTKKNAFVKVSGDLCRRQDFIDWVGRLSKDRFVVILIGGGVQINQALREAGFEVGGPGPLGRELKTLKEKQLARNVLEKNQADLQDLLAEKGIQALVEKPVLEICSVLCHVNGDTFLLTCYLGFEELYAVTLTSRVKTKEKQFALYPKIQVVGFPDSL